jgi:hypothetical protein
MERGEIELSRKLATVGLELPEQTTGFVKDHR